MEKYILFLYVLFTCCMMLSVSQRTHFHESDSPNSYRFGFDTGPGSKNRHFRYEERDEHGFVRGKYGYYDKNGKPHVVEYEAHPKNGYSVKGPFGKYPH